MIYKLMILEFLKEKQPMTSGIYQIYCKENKKRYIGQSINIEQRIKAHKSDLKGNRHQNILLQADYNALGPEKFIYSVLEETKNVITRELFWMFYFEEAIYNDIPKYRSWTKKIHYNRMKKLAYELKNTKI